MNLDGVLGDARKRIETAEAAHFARFDERPPCALCGGRAPHTHVRVSSDDVRPYRPR